MRRPGRQTVSVPHGRFAPSPTGRLHLGNLRTVLVAWLSARSSRSPFTVRMEDLDRVTSSPEHARQQLDDLHALGIDWDGPVVLQSHRFALYDDAIERLAQADLTYPCFCSRREIRDAAQAPHGAEVVYPGTCRDLSERDRAERLAGGRPAALRLRADGSRVTFDDRVLGRVSGTTHDVVLRRNDGVPAYNLAVVVDDAAQGIGEVVRGDDLVSSTPTQIHLARLLGLPVPVHAHVPLVLGPDGERLAKRHGAVTLSDLGVRGIGVDEVRSMLAASIGIAEPGEPLSATDLVDRFDWSLVPHTPWRATLPA